MQWIKDITMGIKERYCTTSPYELCKFLHIKIEKVDKDYFLLNGHKSIYIRDFFGEEIIFIRNDLYRKEEEFYLKHELGHAIIHTNISNSVHMNTGKLERQANYFALALSGIELDLIEIKDKTIKQIASCVEVPYEPLVQLVNL